MCQLQLGNPRGERARNVGNLHELTEAVLDVGGESGGDIGHEARDPDALRNDLDGLLGDDAHRGALLPGPNPLH